MGSTTVSGRMRKVGFVGVQEGVEMPRSYVNIYPWISLSVLTSIVLVS